MAPRVRNFNRVLQYEEAKIGNDEQQQVKNNKAEYMKMMEFERKAMAHEREEIKLENERKIIV